MTTLLLCYQTLLEQGKIRHDPAQYQVVVELDLLAQKLSTRPNMLSWLWIRFLQVLRVPRVPVQGMYLWGGVGRGKTFLMDLFFQRITNERKTRLHFHRFMQTVHQLLHDYQGFVDPLTKVADTFAQQWMIICFDEFYVSDIADAMILTNLFQALFKRGVIFVATSNLHPDDLYLNGLQRDKFLPAIDLIKAHTHVIPILGTVDYRLQYLAQAHTYHYPLEEQAQENLYHYFRKLASSEGVAHKVIGICGRSLATELWDDDVVWCTFENLCATARSVQDYIEIARSFHTVLISHVKVMGTEHEDVARRFIAMIDEFYDHNVTVIISAQAPIDQLYQGTRLAFEFQRTRSRLIEMQSQAYLAKPHIP